MFYLRERGPETLDELVFKNCWWRGTCCRCGRGIFVANFLRPLCPFWVAAGRSLGVQHGWPDPSGAPGGVCLAPELCDQLRFCPRDGALLQAQGLIRFLVPYLPQNFSSLCQCQVLRGFTGTRPMIPASVCWEGEISLGEVVPGEPGPGGPE